MIFNMKCSHPVVAGTFYPDDPKTLRRLLNTYLAAAQDKRNLPIPKAIIAPHAGYIYSGPIAASAYACLTRATYIKTAVILAPSHRIYFSGIAALTNDAYLTPLGPIAIDQEKIKTIVDLPYINTDGRLFNQEHALEVQLPFLQTVLPQTKIVPLLIGDAMSEQVANVLQILWNGRETLIIVSSDLSHYLDYHHAQVLDNQTKNAILSFNATAITEDAACGRIAIAGLILVTAAKKMYATAIDLRNSGDTAGAHDAVVGYGAFHFGEKHG